MGNLFFTNSLNKKMITAIRYNNAKIAYRIDGEGIPLVLIHGFCEDSTIWDNFITGLKGIKTVRPDISGFGESDLMKSNTIENMADTIKAVLDAEDIKECIMVGHSLGGYAALAFMKKYGNMLQGIGLFHSSPFADTEEKKQERLKSLHFVEKNGHIVYVKQIIPRLFAELFASSNEFLINSLIYKASFYRTASIISALNAMMQRGDYADVIKDASIPVLLIVGKLDRSIPYSVSKKMLDLPQLADIHILSKVAHMGLFTERDNTAKVIQNFAALCRTMG